MCDSEYVVNSPAIRRVVTVQSFLFSASHKEAGPCPHLDTVADSPLKLNPSKSGLISQDRRDELPRRADSERHRYS
jgi:hypothetical protein